MCIVTGLFLARSRSRYIEKEGQLGFVREKVIGLDNPSNQPGNERYYGNVGVKSWTNFEIYYIKKLKQEKSLLYFSFLSNSN